MAKPPAGMQLSKDEVIYLERTLSALPLSKNDGAGTGDADGLLKFKYHQNPYLRVYANVLWSGYAVARGQIAEGHQRFSAARRDGQVSAVDAVTAKAMQDAQEALENAMAPDGTIAQFLAVLRDATVQRLWARVCETSGLPPPRFGVLFGQGRGASAADNDAAEERELAALRKVAAPAVLPEIDDDDGDEDGGEDEGADDGQDGGQPTGAPVELKLTASQRGGAEVAAELMLAAVTDLLRQLRGKGATGTVNVTITVEGHASAQRSDTGQRRRRRRR